MRLSGEQRELHPMVQGLRINSKPTTTIRERNKVHRSAPFASNDEQNTNAGPIPEKDSLAKPVRRKNQS
jgi:hypothetical protein